MGLENLIKEIEFQGNLVNILHCMVLNNDNNNFFMGHILGIDSLFYNIQEYDVTKF